MNKKDIRFNVGDEVICIKGYTRKGEQPVKYGETYVVAAVQYCSRCGLQLVNVGYNGQGTTGLVKCVCNNRQMSLNLAWSSCKIFIKASEIDQAIEEMVAIEDYEQAADLLKLK